jgi:hypothetical protein
MRPNKILGVGGERNAYLDYFIAGEVQLWDLHSVACHQIRVKDTKDGLMGDEEQIILLAFELKDDRFQADSNVMVGLVLLVYEPRTKLPPRLTSARGYL